MTRDEVEKRLADLKLALQRVDERLRDSLRPFCDANGYPFMGRVKTADSVADKIESGRFSKWSQIDDLVGYTIIVPSLDHEAEVLSFLTEEFVTKAVKMRGQASKSPDAFRFDSTRFIGSLRDRVGEGSDEPVFKAEFEVQVRTAFEHAWSVTTHKATYKPEMVDWRRLRLAAHLKATVEQLDVLVVGFDSISQGLSTAAWPEVDAQVKVVERVAALRGGGSIEEVSMPSSLGRLSESVVSLVRAARRSSFRKLVTDVEDALQLVSEEVDAGGKCPRSLSVYQWFFTILARRGFLSSLPDDYPLPLDDAIALELDVGEYRFRSFEWTA